MSQTSLVEWVAAPPKAISLQGFRYTNRAEVLEWRLLHGIDPDAVVKLTDVRAVEDCLHTLQHGNVEQERNLTSKNCIQLFRLLQLAIEYLWHLRTAHASLMQDYINAIAAADRWKLCAHQYLDTGAQFVNACLASGDISHVMLDAVDAARNSLEQQELVYNAALDKLEEEDARVRYFHFRKQRTELNWKQLCAVDIERMMAAHDTQIMDKVLPGLVFGCISSEDREALTSHHFHQLIPLAQCGLDYMTAQATATGMALEQAMSALQSACSPLPGLMSATQQLHNRITSFLLDAQEHAAKVTGIPVTSGRMTGSPSAPGTQQLPGTFLRPGSPLVSHMAMMGAATSVPMVMQPARMGSGQVWTREMDGASSGGVLLSDGLMAGSPHHQILTEMFRQGSVPGSTLDMHARTADLHYRLDTLTSDIRVERSRTDEMRRLVADIRDKVLLGGPGGGGGAGYGPAGGSGMMAANLVQLPSLQQRMPRTSSGGTADINKPRHTRNRTVGRPASPGGADGIDGAVEEALAMAGLDLAALGAAGSGSGQAGAGSAGGGGGGSGGPDKPGSMRQPVRAKTRLGARGGHTRTNSLSKNGAAGGRGAGGAEITPGHSRTGSRTQFGLSSDADQ